MHERRLHRRLLCADLVTIHWKEDGGKARKAVANLEDISLSGACLQLDQPIPLNIPVRITVPNGQMTGVCRYCVYREIGYFVGIEFAAGSNWTRKLFKPQHMFDPTRLVSRRAGKSGPPEPRGSVSTN